MKGRHEGLRQHTYRERRTAEATTGGTGRTVDRQAPFPNTCTSSHILRLDRHQVGPSHSHSPTPPRHHQPSNRREECVKWDSVQVQLWGGGGGGTPTISKDSAKQTRNKQGL